MTRSQQQSSQRRFMNHWQSGGNTTPSETIQLTYDDFIDKWFMGRKYIMSKMLNGQYYSFPPALTLPGNGTRMSYIKFMDITPEYRTLPDGHAYTVYKKTYSRMLTAFRSDTYYPSESSSTLKIQYGAGETEDNGFVVASQYEISRDNRIYAKNITMNCIIPVFELILYSYESLIVSDGLVDTLKALCQEEGRKNKITVPRGVVQLLGSDKGGTLFGTPMEESVAKESGTIVLYSGAAGPVSTPPVSGLTLGNGKLLPDTKAEALPGIGRPILTAYRSQYPRYMYCWSLKQLLFMENHSINEIYL